ncbi:MAG: CRISPR system precrRNA processing endoribonuclease RAMP protein Cas6 [Anaerolineae bacterium]|nr:CRISPR system precrRNA processing endoribonuclease RAMP protein Cas6 [Anaerolineae bacterium]
MLSQLPLLRLRFCLRVTEAAALPPYKGDLLRFALLWHLGSLWCREPERCRDGCRQPGECLFGRLIEPLADSTWSEPLRRLMGSTPPPAYTLWDCQDRRTQVLPGDRFSFELTLIGETAIRQLPAFLAAFMICGERGIGRERLRGQLERVEALSGPDGQVRELLVDGAWQGGPVEEMAIGYADGLHWAIPPIFPPASGRDRGGVTRFCLRFLSPVEVKVKGQVARTPEFPALARAAVRRLRILSEVHGVGEWSHAGYGPLLDLADGVRLEHHETTWLCLPRHSQRGGWMATEGFVGQAWYVAEGDVRPLLAALWLGQWLGVGKGATWGGGRYEVQVVE